MRAFADGSVGIYTSISEVGQGTHTRHGQGLRGCAGPSADAGAGLPVDTAFVPDSGATAVHGEPFPAAMPFGSRRKNLRAILSSAVDEEKVIFQDGWLTRTDGTPRLMTFSEAVKNVYEQRHPHRRCRAVGSPPNQLGFFSEDRARPIMLSAMAPPVRRWKSTRYRQGWKF